MKERHRFDDRKQPVSIYETSLEEWKSAEELVEFLAEEDFTHVELHPVMEYLDDITGGYSTYAYYAPTSRFGSVADFQKLVDALHQAGVGVILDWTPAQFRVMPPVWRNLTEHLFMRDRIRQKPFIRSGEHCSIITEARW